MVASTFDEYYCEESIDIVISLVAFLKILGMSEENQLITLQYSIGEDALIVDFEEEFCKKTATFRISLLCNFDACVRLQVQCKYRYNQFQRSC